VIPLNLFFTLTCTVLSPFLLVRLLTLPVNPRLLRRDDLLSSSPSAKHFSFSPAPSDSKSFPPFGSPTISPLPPVCAADICEVF